jgi:hypothetical protein|tara:strand:- start:387 stop:818 length:432 start_codon:yes stop_codon:yes gene_type:complete
MFLTFSSAASNEISAEKPSLTQDKEEQRSAFIGKWESTQPTKEGGTRKTIIDRQSDSRYIVEFTVLNSKSEIEYIQKEFGFWGVSGGIYFTMYRGSIENDEFYPVDPNNAYNYDAYQIVSATESILNYQSLSSKNIFTYTRVK